MEAVYPLFALVLVVISATTARISLENNVYKLSWDNHREDDHKGHAYSCSPDPNQNFTASWLPEKVELNNYVKVWFSMKSGMPFSSGQMDVLAYSSPAPEPVFKGSYHVTCDDLEQYVPGVCPFKANKSVSVDGSLVKLVTSKLITASDYEVHVTLKNEFNQDFGCILANITIVDPDEY